MDARAIDRAAEQLVEGDEPVPIVEVQAAEQLVGLVTQPADQEPMRGGRGIKQWAGAQRLGIVTARQLERRLQATVAGGAQAACGEQGGAIGAQQLAERMV